MEFERVCEIIADILGIDAQSIRPESSLSEDLEADSLSAVEILMALEEETGLEISEDDAVNMKTVSDIMTYLDEHVR